ncbi:MAG: A/G-specific adenine glycosylase [Candidatus Paceibacterota bacterium]
MTKEVFQNKIWNHYYQSGRKLPWRTTKNPYRILVSEIMLQQTQVDRVVPKYKNFLKTFPTLEALAKASLKEVLVCWQGLGYNRRAKMLHETAVRVMEVHGGKIPKTKEALIKLPGIGDYTAGAICVFAYNTSEVLIETNVRSVYIHFFFKKSESVSDTEIRACVRKTQDVANPREWYYALMDYGSMLKKEGNPSRKSKYYTKQSTFKDSDRQIRGSILKTVLESSGGITELKLLQTLDLYEKSRIRTQLKALQGEGFVKNYRKKICVT